MWTWGTSYSSKGDYVLLFEQARWSAVVEQVFVPFLRFRGTHFIAERMLNLAERGITEVHRLPMPSEMSEAWWRELESDY